jgi:hypothetical protein
VPIFKERLPIPRRLNMAFGLYEGSEVNVARILDKDTQRTFASELIVSPIPTQFWNSVCRLSLRVADRPGALCVATGFLRDRRINILLSECASSFAQRAHWDAICDLSLTAGFETMAGIPREDYSQKMQEYLDTLTAEFAAFMDTEVNRPAFPEGAAKLVQFSPLTGLNDASFICDLTRSDVVTYEAGAIQLPPRLALDISRHCRMPTDALPDYAIITGNTEQRYMRILFLRDHDSMFRAVINDDLGQFAGGGIGLLNRLLAKLPDRINLLHTSNYIFSRLGAEAKGRIILIGHWDLPELQALSVEERQRHMKSEFTRLIDGLQVEDIEGRKHSSALKLVTFDPPRTIYPRVFISYSLEHAADELHQLMALLLQHQFQPVVGTDVGRPSPFVDQLVSPDVMQASFQEMSSCVAFVSLQVRREDYKIVDPMTGGKRYVVPPWSVAEEVWAWANSIGPIIRLKDKAIEDPQYNHNVLTVEFQPNHDFQRAVMKVVARLEELRRKPWFEKEKLRAREEQFEHRYAPVDY